MEVVNAEEAMDEDTAEHIVKQVNEMSLPSVEISNPPLQQIRSSSRERRFAEKGLEMREQEAKKKEKVSIKLITAGRRPQKRLGQE